MSADAQHSSTPLEAAFLDLVLETWRFARISARLLDRLDPGDGDRHGHQLRYHARRLNTIAADGGLTIVELEGQPYDPGIPASVINIGDFGPEVVLHIAQTIEPVIMGPEGVWRPGVVRVGELL